MLICYCDFCGDKIEIKTKPPEPKPFDEIEYVRPRIRIGFVDTIMLQKDICPKCCTELVSEIEHKTRF